MNTHWSCCRSRRLSRRLRTAPTRSRRRSTALKSCRINHFFVGCCEQRDGGCEGQVGSNELLEDRGIVCRGKSQVVECGFEMPDRQRCRRDHTVSPTERLPPPQSKDLSLALHVRKAEGRFHAVHVQEAEGRPSQSSTSRGKCWAVRTAAEAIITSSTLAMGMPACVAFFCTSSNMLMYWGVPSAWV
jgi:hypothetical protein